MQTLVKAVDPMSVVDRMLPMNQRWALYARLVTILGDELRRAPWLFLSDARDVVVPNDPCDLFTALCTRAPLHLYAEGEPTRAALISDDDFNSRWVRELGGEGALSDLEDAKVLCCGTVLVRPDALEQLCRRMAATMAQPQTLTRWLVDQGALNLLYHRGALDDLGPIVHANGEGGVVTLGLISASPVWQRRGRRVLIAGREPSIVHQYDRIPELVQAWAPGEDLSTPRQRSEVCGRRRGRRRSAPDALGQRLS